MHKMSVTVHKKKSAKNNDYDSNNTNYENYLHSLSEPQLQQIITLSDNDAPTPLALIIVETEEDQSAALKISSNYNNNNKNHINHY